MLKHIQGIPFRVQSPSFLALAGYDHLVSECTLSFNGTFWRLAVVFPDGARHVKLFRFRDEAIAALGGRRHVA